MTSPSRVQFEVPMYRRPHSSKPTVRAKLTRTAQSSGHDDHGARDHRANGAGTWKWVPCACASPLFTDGLRWEDPTVGSRRIAPKRTSGNWGVRSAGRTRSSFIESKGEGPLKRPGSAGQKGQTSQSSVSKDGVRTPTTWSSRRLQRPSDARAIANAIEDDLRGQARP